MKGSIRIVFGIACLILAVGVIEDCAGDCYRPLGWFDYLLSATFALSGSFFAAWGITAQENV